MIRHATVEDVPTIALLGHRFHEEAGWGDIADYVPADCEKALTHLVESDDGILIVADEGGIVGMAGGLCHPLYFNHAHKSGQEMFWWVDPRSRNGVGAQMLDALEAEAKAKGCKSWAMIALAKVKPELMGRVYQRRGYRASENTWIKRL
jgi:GNAT superfamily N-acetyltransferase